MKRVASILLLILGIASLTAGWDAYRSARSGFSRVFTGLPSDRALWLLIGGGVACVAGVGGLARSRGR